MSTKRLMRRLCPSCKVPRELSQIDRMDLGIPADISGQAYTAGACDRCRGTGFAGRLAIYEIVLITDAMQELVAHGAPSSKMREQAIRDGYVPMRTYGWHKAMQGETTIEEVISVTTTEHAKAE